MALTQDQRTRLRSAATRQGVDPEELIAAAERELSPGEGGRPVAERLLIGFLPFMTVDELREGWLGLGKAPRDGSMYTGEFLQKYGAAAGSDDDE